MDSAGGGGGERGGKRRMFLVVRLCSVYMSVCCVRFGEIEEYLCVCV